MNSNNRLLRYTIFYNQKGQSLVELAILLPILLLIFLGMADFARVGHAYLVLSNAAREGARFGAIGSDNIKIAEEIKSRTLTLNNHVMNDNIKKTPGDTEIDTYELAKMKITIEPTAENRDRGEKLEVKISYSIKIFYSFLIPLLQKSQNHEVNDEFEVKDKLTITTIVIMRIE